MPCVSPLGYPAKKMSFRETMMRKGISADSRLPFEELFYENDFMHAYGKENSELNRLLEYVRFAPSAVNKQPWRVIVNDGMAHFYCKRSKGFGSGELDMQMIDMGIALCHFALAAQECGLDLEFMQNDPRLAEDMAYVASYRVK